MCLYSCVHDPIVGPGFESGAPKHPLPPPTDRRGSPETPSSPASATSSQPLRGPGSGREGRCWVAGPSIPDQDGGRVRLERPTTVLPTGPLVEPLLRLGRVPVPGRLRLQVDQVLPEEEVLCVAEGLPPPTYAIHLRLGSLPVVPTSLPFPSRLVRGWGGVVRGGGGAGRVGATSRRSQERGRTTPWKRARSEGRPT